MPRLVWVATKSPWPPVDGGRLLMQVSVEALLARGLEIEVLAPEEAGRRSWAGAWVRSLREGLPLPVARHRDPALEGRVRAALRERRPVAVHVEQVHAMPQAEPARRLGVPVVLRAQNVESDLWRQAAGRGVRALIGRPLARRFAAWEGRAVADADRTLAVTEADRRSLEELAGGRARVLVPPVPFPGALPAADPLPGSPVVSLFVGRGWAPSREGAAWFLREAWPEVRRRCPEARLHWFGERGELGGGGDAPGPTGVSWHPPPPDSRAAFPEGGILVVPLRTASGIRMKVLEAWSRGLPVVGTRRALEGLEGEDGTEWLSGDDAREMAEAIAGLAGDPEIRGRLVAAGRRRLASHHAPERFAAAYSAVLDGLGAGSPP